MGEPRKPLGYVFFQIADPAATHGLFDSLENHGNVGRGLTGPNDEMDMFGHEHESPKVEVESLARLMDRFGQPLARPLGQEEAVPPIAGERQLVGKPRFITGSATSLSFSVPHDP